MSAATCGACGEEGPGFRFAHPGYELRCAWDTKSHSIFKFAAAITLAQARESVRINSA